MSICLDNNNSMNPAGQMPLMNSTVPYVQQSQLASMINDSKPGLQLIILD